VDWEAIGATGEIVSAAAVVFTLIYLSIQIRHSKSAVEENTRTARISVLDLHTRAQSVWRGSLSTNEGLASVWVSAKSGRSNLTDIELERFTQHARDFFNVWRSSYAAAQSVGHSGQMDHISRSFAQTLSGHRGVREAWNDGGKFYSELVVPEFVVSVQQRLDDLESGSGS
jgi:uncharacterized protein with FMN-binding domain